MSLQSHGGCCAPIVPDIEPDPHAAVRSRLGPLDPYLKAGEDGTVSLNMMIEGISCGGCIARIEQALKGESGVAEARVNFSTSRLKVVFDPAQVAPENLIVLLDGLGYRAVPYDPAVLRAGRDEEERRLLRAMAVAGFAAANVMLLSVAV